MATIQIFHEETGSTSTVTVTLNSAIMSDADMTRDTYLILTTTIPQAGGGSYPAYIIRTLADTAPTYPTASNFTELIDGYVEYFVDQSQLGQSSSSSETSSESSSTSSGGYSESSSSSGGNSASTESSSSGGYSASTQSASTQSESSSSSEENSDSTQSDSTQSESSSSSLND